MNKSCGKVLKKSKATLRFDSFVGYFMYKYPVMLTVFISQCFKKVLLHISNV